jgi:hypothetical protein
LNPSDRRSGPRADFGSTLALTVTLALAAFAVVMAVVMLVVEPVPIPPRGELGEQRQDAETALYLLAFLVVLPLALILAPRLADSLAAGPNTAMLPALTGLLLAALAAAILLARLSDLFSWGGGMGALLGAVAAWWVGAGAVAVRALRPWPRTLPLGGVRFARLAWAAAGLLTFGVLMSLTDLGSVSVLAIALGGAAVPALLAAARHPPRWRLRNRWGSAADLVIAGLLLLAVPDLVIFRPEEAAGSVDIALETGIIQFHQDFLLGPASQVLGGNGVLVDTASQYGVGSIYLLAGWFQLAPIGYGTFGFLDGVLTALFYVAGYCLLRIAGCSRLLAASALAIAVVALVFNLVYPVGGLPQQGPLRFGLPLAVVLATVAGAHWPERSTAAEAAALLALGLSSIWALEAFAATAATFLALAAARAYLLAPGDRIGFLRRLAALAAGACLAAHLIFAAATLAATGELPEWGQYLAYLDAFLFGQLGDLTYDFSRWSPGLAVGAAYLASAAGVILLLRREPSFARRERVALIALAGTTAYGIALYSYFVNRSADHILPYVSLPALLSGALWLGLLLRPGRGAPPAVRTGAVAFSLAVAVLLLAVAASSIGSRFERSALAHAFPRGNSLRDAIDRLWHPPPLDPRAPAGEALLARFMPGEGRSLILVSPDLGTEIMIRAERPNRLPLGDPREDSFVISERLPGLREAVAELRAGDRLLADRAALAVLAAQRSNSSPARPRGSGASAPLAPLQRWAMLRIAERFRLRPIHRDPLGFFVIELASRR